VLAYSPLASGLLTGRFSLDRLQPEDWRRRGANFQEPKLSQALALVERLRGVADRHGVGVAALAVAWVLAVPGVTAAIVGARRPEQADEWLAAADLALSPADVEEIEAAIAESGAGTETPPSPPGVSPERLAAVLGS
jgi:aryl-alcohol dehydrogenase-like predicted oxidoreductase